MTTLAYFRSFVREHMDLSADEMPNSLVDEFVKDASLQIDTFERSWAFQANVWELDTVSGQIEYTKDDFVDLSDTGTFAPNNVTAIFDPDGKRLPYKGRATVAQGRGTGAPKGWADWGDKYFVIPIPDDSYTLSVFGDIDPLSWIGDSPDGTEVSPYPQPFDQVITQWTLGRAYAQQEEGATAVSYYDLANYNLTQLARKYNSVNPIDDLIMNGGGIDLVENA